MAVQSSKQRVIHLEVEILGDIVTTTACGVTPTDTNATWADYQVTCKKCLKEMGCAV